MRNVSTIHLSPESFLAFLPLITSFIAPLELLSERNGTSVTTRGTKSVGVESLGLEPLGLPLDSAPRALPGKGVGCTKLPLERIGPGADVLGLTTTEDHKASSSEMVHV